MISGSDAKESSSEMRTAEETSGLAALTAVILESLC